MKRSFFQAAVTSILLYGCTTWTLTKRLEKKLDGNYTRMQRAILNKSWRQHPTRHQLYGHLPPITKIIQVRRTRHAGHCCRSRDELIRDVLLWTPTHGRAKAGRPARTYIQQLCEDTGCGPALCNERYRGVARLGQGYPCYQRDMMMMMIPLVRALPGATTPGQSGPGSDGNKEVLLIPQTFSITGTPPSDFSVSYPGFSLGGVGSCSSAAVQSVYSTAPEIVFFFFFYSYKQVTFFVLKYWLHPSEYIVV